MKHIFLYLLLLIISASCADNNEERTDGYTPTAEDTADSLFQEVMEGHNVAMAKMGKLRGYHNQVQKKIDSLAAKGKKAGSSFRQELDSLGADLKKAEEDMNTWMKEFSIDSAENNVEQRIEYLKSEKLRVNDVRERIFRALDKADSVLSQ